MACQCSPFQLLHFGHLVDCEFDLQKEAKKGNDQLKEASSLSCRGCSHSISKHNKMFGSACNEATCSCNGYT